jgi:predicted nucleotidyltransferase
MAGAIPTLTALRSKRAAILHIAAQHGASNIRVFGSVARGDATEDSDIDLLVDYDAQQLSGSQAMEIVLELENLLGWSVDVVTEADLKPVIRDSALKDVVPL